MRLETMTAAGLLAAASLAASPAQASSAFSNVNSVNTSQCLDNATDSDGWLQMWSCDSGNDEQWLFLRNGAKTLFVNQRTGLCATVSGGFGSSVTMKPCNSGAENQLWHPYKGGVGVPSTSWQNDASGGYCLWAQNTANRSGLTVGNCYETGDPRLYWQKR